jgi:Domain of Unknown Function (DUF1080)/FG-GAP-like repeat
MTKKPLSFLVALAVAGAAPLVAVGPAFIPDVTFTGSSLAGWHTVGNAEWRAENGEIVGKPTSASGGWLVLDQSYQDVGVYTEYRCTGGCQTGVLFRESKSDGATKGTFVNLSDPDIPTYTVTLAADGSISSKDAARRGGGLIRFTAPPAPGAAGAAAGGRPLVAAPADLPFKMPDVSLKAGEWNTAEMYMDANVVRSFLNDGREHGFVSDLQYGPFALYVGGTGEVRFKNLKYKDLSQKTRQPDHVSPNFRKQVLTDFFYSFAVTAADFNKDGVMDIASGPFIYYGPDYTKSEEIYPAEGFNQTSGFASDAWIQSAADFTGHGYPDIISTNYGSLGVNLYVNPGKEHHRWEKYQVVKEVQSEVAILRDVDGTGKPAIVYMGGGQVRYAKPDPANPTGLWIIHNVSEKGYGTAHGIGVGDINGDGRMDLVTAYGWWEQPATLSDATWKYHPVAFGRYGRGIMGGATMGVYDVNGDGLPDVVTALNVHGWGLAWFEQKRDGQGNITFEKHMIADDLNSKAENAGGVAFSEPHASAFADVNGDGIPDFIVGKRYLSHVNTFLDPDPFGQPVMYVYKVVHDKSAPGGARFQPELIDNEAGVGSDIVAMDLNHDGATDIVTAGRFGTDIYWGIPGAEEGKKK